jgi:hypothetical protein
MCSRTLLAICGSCLAGLLLSPVALGAEAETLLYARYLDQPSAWDGLDVIADGQEGGTLRVKAGAYLTKRSSKLLIEKWRPTATSTAAAMIEGLVEVLKRSPGKLQSCGVDMDEPLALRASCPEQKDAYLTLAAFGIPKATVMRIRNSFPYWYSGYSADEAAIVMVVPPGQVPELVKKLQKKTRVMDLIAYTVPVERIEYARDQLLQPAAGVRPASFVTTP